MEQLCNFRIKAYLAAFHQFHDRYAYLQRHINVNQQIATITEDGWRMGNIHNELGAMLIKRGKKL